MSSERSPDRLKTMPELSDAKIIDSWQKNAAPWTDAVRNDEIESRRLITNAAIVETVAARNPATVLDIGCGEGWLARALSARGIRVTGVDVVPELVARAQAAGGADYRVASYEAIAAGAISERFDVAVANFALIGKEAVDNLIAATPSLLTTGGALVVQTLHPLMATAEQPYIDGWRTGSWSGFSDAFTDPAPWYFRTLASWTRLIVSSGLRLIAVHEPVSPKTNKPASLILVGERTS